MFLGLVVATLETALTAAVTLRTLSAALDLAFCRAKVSFVVFIGNRRLTSTALARRRDAQTGVHEVHFTHVVACNRTKSARSSRPMRTIAPQCGIRRKGGDLERALAAVVRVGAASGKWPFI